MKRLKRLALLLMPTLFVSSAPLKDNEEALSREEGRARFVTSFACDVKRHYCDAHWVCRAFEYMSVPEFVAGWQQLTSLIDAEHDRWFYAHDAQCVYDERLQKPYSHLKRYNRESLDVEWFKECEIYHAFLKDYVVDMEHMIIVKKDEKERFKASYKKKHPELQELLIQQAPEAVIVFYQFFFEQISNVMLKKLNYLYEDTAVEIDNILQLIQHKDLMSEIYRICIHRTGQASSDCARKMAYHYNRLESVLDMVVSDVLKRLGIA